MAEKHDRMLAHYRARLANRGFKIMGRSPFVDYRPDIYAMKNSTMLFVEVEIETTFENPHTLEQLDKMYDYVSGNGRRKGVLLVPRSVAKKARFLIDSLFGDRRISVHWI